MDNWVNPYIFSKYKLVPQSPDLRYYGPVVSSEFRGKRQPDKFLWLMWRRK